MTPDPAAPEMPTDIQRLLRMMLQARAVPPGRMGRLLRRASRLLPAGLQEHARRMRRERTVQRAGLRALRGMVAALPPRAQASLRATRLAGWVRRRGWRRGQGAPSEAARLRRDVLFDAEWYLSRHPDVRASGLDPWFHFERYGAAEGRSPGPLFNAAAYLRAYPDVAGGPLDPVRHFLLAGAAEGRRWFIHADAPGMGGGIRDAFAVPRGVDAYGVFCLIDRWSAARAEALRQEIAGCARRPLISVLMPVFAPDPAHLREAVESVRAQVYPHWQLSLGVDGPVAAEVELYLRQLEASEPRVAVSFRPERGHISAATNTAAEAASGEFLLLLDQDDLLSPDALARCALAINSREDVDYVFSDSDKIDAEGRRCAPHLKPPFSPELLLAYMCAGQLLCVRASLWREVGGMRLGFEGSQDHDFALRATEVARRVAHVPAILYHWRIAPGSTAGGGNAKPYAFEAGRRAVQDALLRRGSAGRAEQPAWAVANGNAAFDIAFPDDGPSVGIVIPTRNRLDLIRPCVESLRATSYANFRVLVVDNGSDDADTIAWLDGLEARDPRVRLLRCPNPPGATFSFSRQVNAGVRALDTEFVLLLNNDTRVVAPGWLSAMVGYGQLPGVGAVGALLLFPDGTVQHAGVYCSGRPPHHVGHMHKGAPGGTHALRFARNVSAVTGACMLVRRARYLALGGFDEGRFAVAYNDVDFCHRLRAGGERIVLTPAAVLIHDEGATRGFLDNPAELAALRAAHPARGDACINPGIVLDDALQVQPRCAAAVLRRPARILACTHNLNREGAPKALLEVCRQMARAWGARITLRSPADGPLATEARDAGMEVEILPHPLAAGGNEAGYEEAIGARAERMQVAGHDVVLANTLLEFHAVDAAREAGIPSVWLVHENEDSAYHFAPLPGAVHRRARACFGHPYRVVFVAEATRRVHQALDFHGNATVIPGGIPPGWAARLDAGLRAEARAAIGAAPGDIVVLSVGTICGRKRQADLVAALSAAGADLRVVLAGKQEPGYAGLLMQAVRELPPDLRDRVTVLDEVADPLPLYAGADVFALCSAQESYPRVILEAMAAGLPVVTTLAGGIGEQVRAGVNAECFAVGDTAGLAVALGRMRDPALRARYGAASRQIHAVLNSSDDVGRELWQVIREAIGAGVPPSRLAQM
jgi:GT2 family glycosyltransferase/glycosyltransferase involved in cell wall biosynthesis